MTLTSFTSSSMSLPYSANRKRRRIIIAFVTISGLLMIIMMLCYDIGMFMKCTSINSDKSLETNNNITQLASNIPIILLTNEFSTTSNESNGNQMNNNNNNKSNSGKQRQQHYKISVGDENSHASIVTIRGNNSNLLANLPMTHQNNFVDEINIGNQHGEFNARLTAMNLTTPRTPATVFVSAMANSIDLPFDDAQTINHMVSNTEKSDWIKYESIHQQQLPQNQVNTELVLHRQKRYLIFPEGSSFQMVFDLIIGIVGYTSYAILGITCAVAWELPSKPPSELIENLHEKLTEGIYTTSETKPTAAAAPAAAMRRNDSIALPNGSGSNDGVINYGMDAERIKYVDNTNTVTPTHIKYENIVSSQVLTAPPPAPPLPLNAMETTYYTPEHQPNPFAVPITSYNAYKKVSPDNRYYTNDGAYQPKNYYANAHHNSNKKYYSLPHKYSFPDKNEKSSYYDVNDSSNYSNNKNLKNPFGYSAHGNSRDKQPAKFTNQWQQEEQQQRHQQPQYKKWQSWQDYDSNWRSYQQQQQQQEQQKWKHAKWAQKQQKYQQQQQQQKWATQSKYVGMDNWWSRNKQHVADIWRTKQSDLRPHNVRIPASPVQPHQPMMTYSPPTESFAGADATVSPQFETVKGRNFDDVPRLVLTTTPKPKIYPVFGRRRRRRRRGSNAKLDAFELKLERIHLREQLRSRQKLYGKIEKLYETRGLNGTACVLRALCETGQQVQKQQAYKTEPQSFITELLRAIFTLPTIRINSAGEAVKFEEPALHPTDLHIVDRTYREAQAQRDSCTQLFTMCEHSLWE